MAESYIKQRESPCKENTKERLVKVFNIKPTISLILGSGVYPIYSGG